MNEKLKSRKFIFTCLWNAFVLIGLISTMVIGKDIAYIEKVITFAGVITASYVGIQGYADAKNKVS